MLHLGMPYGWAGRVAAKLMRLACSSSFLQLIEIVLRFLWVFLLRYNRNEPLEAVATSRSKPRYTPAMRVCWLAKNIGS